MSDLQLPYNLNEDAKQRTEWLDKRIQLASGEKEYVEFQIKEAVTRALREANDSNARDSGLHLQRVSNCNATLDRCECEEPKEEPIKICLNCNGYIE